MIQSDFLNLLPDRPYCTDRLGEKLLIRPKETAASFPIIQHNSPMIWRWMMFDLDCHDAWFRPEDRALPAPTFIALNPANGHGHAAYLLESPVSAFAKSSRNAMKFYESVERGMTHRLGADKGYTGFLSKNPLHPKWITDWQSKIPYRLDTLNDFLEPGDKRKRSFSEPSAIGRNCSVFDSVRLIAYRQCYKFQKSGRTIDEFMVMLRSAADCVNCSFSSPLSSPEINGIVRSVAKWCYEEFSVTRFSRIQSKRGSKSWSKTETLTKLKPWESAGVSRRTWYRKRASQRLLS